MLASTKTSLQKAKQQEITYVKATPRWWRLQLSLLLDKRLVLSPTRLNLTAFDPPPFQKPIQHKTKHMQWRVVVPANDDCRAKTTQPLSNHGTGSYGGQLRFVNSSRNLRASRWTFLFKYEFPILLRAANTRVPDKNSPSAIGEKFEWLPTTNCSHCSTLGNEDPCLIFWRKQQVKRANSPNEWYP